MARYRYGWFAVTALAGAAVFGLPLVSGASPEATPVHAKFVVAGKQVGTGTVIRYNGEVYVSTAAVRTITGAQLNWDAATATLSGAASTTTGAGGARTYLETLPNQPYYSSSVALCWQYADDNKASVMQGKAGYTNEYCRPGLSHRPPMASEHYTYNITVMVSADAHKKPDTNNTVTLDYDLAGKYRTFSGTAGLVDSPFNRDPMELKIEGDGRTLGDAVIPPAGLPAPFKVSVAGVRQLSIVVSNVSAAAPNWDELPAQYSPGAVMIANPVLGS